MEHSPATGMLHVLIIVVVIIAAVVTVVVRSINSRKSRAQDPEESDAHGSRRD